MFSQADLDRLIDAMRANDVTVLEVETGADRLKLDLGPPAAAVSDIAPATAPHRLAAQSPCIGRFVPRGTDDGLSPLEGPAEVKAGDTLGYIAQRQARAIIVAPANGTLVSNLPVPGTVFGYGDVVFELDSRP